GDPGPRGRAPRPLSRHPCGPRPDAAVGKGTVAAEGLLAGEPVHGPDDQRCAAAGLRRGTVPRLQGVRRRLRLAGRPRVHLLPRRLRGAVGPNARRTDGRELRGHVRAGLPRLPRRGAGARAEPVPPGPNVYTQFLYFVSVASRYALPKGAKE